MFDSRYRRLPLTAIDPAGMIGDLLLKQAAGLTGHLSDVFPDVGPDSAWLGGSGESWERGPYYLDGLVPLAFLTRDPSLSAKMEEWIGAILGSQRPDGFFGPAVNDDWWPRFVALKAVVQYAEATDSARARRFLVRFCDHMVDHIESRPPAFWGYARGLEAFPAILFVAKATGDPRHLELLRTLSRLTYPWAAFFRSFPYPEPTGRYLNRTLFLAVRPILALLDGIAKRHPRPDRRSAAAIRRDNAKKGNVLYLTTHGVNLAMAVKYPVYESFLAGEPSAEPALSALDAIATRHGTAAGAFSSDEHLDGPGPDRGIELCAVVELMHSLGETLALTSDVTVADRLERLLWNTLPATLTEDLCAHQYLQQTDQPEATVKRRRFYDSGPRSTIFGVAPNYGCCAANMHQGFPKAAATAMLLDEAGATLFLILAGTYRLVAPTGSATVVVESGYPFEDVVRIRVETVSGMPLSLRLRRPFGAAATVDGTPFEGEVLALSDGMKTGDAFSVRFDFAVRTLTNPDGTRSVFRGPLLFCERLEAREVRLGGTPPFHDRAFVPASRIRHSLSTRGGEAVVVSFEATAGTGFHDSDAVLTVAGVAPDGTREPLSLHPYGLSPLRYTHFATLEESR
ncbi:MAG: beta-L-arabinofuranosidase domain-containing protein [Candidatus Izemoplasmatales bacterium]